MEPMETLHALAARARQQSGHLQHEEAVRTSLVFPFLQALGYDVFDPEQVTPDPLGEAGLPHRRRVDLLLRSQGRPAILLECRPFGADLGDLAATSLYWGFSSAGARIGVLTNGTRYHFHADQEQPGVLDDQPFFTFDLLTFQKGEWTALQRFAPASLDVDALLSGVADRRLARRIPGILADQMAAPSLELLQVVAHLAQAGPLEDEAHIEAFAQLVRQGFQQVLAGAVPSQTQPGEAVQAPVPVASPEASLESQVGGAPEASPEVLPAVGSLTGMVGILDPADEQGELGAEPGVTMPACLQEEAPAPGKRPKVLAVGMAFALVAVGAYAGTRLFKPGHKSAPFQIRVDQPSPLNPDAHHTAAPAASAPASTFLGAVEAGDLEAASRMTEGRMAALQPDRWTLRLVIAHEPPTVLNLLAAIKGREEQVFLRPIQMRDGRGCYQVFLGDFQDEASARQAALQLPPEVTEGGRAPKLFKGGDIPTHQ